MSARPADPVAGRVAALAASRMAAPAAVRMAAPAADPVARRVVCLGDVMVDVLARLPGPLEHGTDTPAPVELFGGGSAANTAAWLAAAGVPTTLLGRIGDDALGRMVVDELAGLGIDLQLTVDPTRPTGTCIVLVDAGGERTMVPSAGANAAMGALPVPTLRADDHLHVSAYALFHEGARPAVDAIVAAAHAVGASVSVDAASVAPLRRYGPSAFLDWLPAGLLLANADEAALLAAEPDPRAAAVVLAARCGEAVVKCGRDGAVWSDGTDVRQLAAEQVAVVDSTGAGDAFAAGMIAARVRGAPADEALATGCRWAAQAVSAVGARPADPGSLPAGPGRVSRRRT